MLINLTAEEQKHIQEIRNSYREERQKSQAAIDAATDQEERKRLLIQHQAIIDRMEDELQAYSDTLQQERFAKITGGAAGIITHAKVQAPVILEALYKEYFTFYAGDPFTEDLINKTGFLSMKQGKLYINANYAAKQLREEMQLHIKALRNDKAALQELLAVIVEAAEDSPLTDNTEIKTDEEDTPAPLEVARFRRSPIIATTDSAILKANMPMYHGKATDVLATLSNRDITENPIADKAIIENKAENYKLVIQEISTLKGKLGVNTHKLLCTAIAEFTQINNYGGGSINPKIVIPFTEYARKLGYKVDENPTSTPEAAAKEKKRAQEVIKAAKKRIRRDLELLQAMRLTWTEKIKGKGTDFDSVLLLERVAIKKDYIIMEFGRNMAEYLKQLPLTQYPQGLLSIDARSENAYRIGLKMAEHFSMDNNQVRGTATRLKVSSLLAASQLPTLETLQQEQPDDSRHWDRRIKEPFEASLDVLTGKVISNWEYVKAKGEPLTHAEAYNITDYNVFASLLVQFELLKTPDHKDRLERRAGEKKAAAAKKAAQKRKEGQR